MFEFNGEQYSLEQLQSVAEKKGYTIEELFKKNPTIKEVNQKPTKVEEVKSPVGGFFSEQAKTDAVVGPVATATAKQQTATNMASPSVDGSLDLQDPRKINVDQFEKMSLDQKRQLNYSDRQRLIAERDAKAAEKNKLTKSTKPPLIKVSTDQALFNYEQRTGKKADSLMNLTDEDYDPTPFELRKFKPVDKVETYKRNRDRLNELQLQREKLRKKAEVTSYEVMDPMESVDYVKKTIEEFDKTIANEVKIMNLNPDFKLRNEAIVQLSRNSNNTRATGDAVSDLSSELGILNLFKGKSYYKNLESTETIELNDEVEDAVINNLDERSLQKLAGGFYTLEEKENIINNVKIPLIKEKEKQIYSAIEKLTAETEFKVDNYSKEINNINSLIGDVLNGKQKNEQGKYILNEEESKAYNTLINKYQEVTDKIKSTKENYDYFKKDAINKFNSYQGELGVDLAKQTISNNFKLSNDADKFRESYAGDGFWNATKDVIGGELVQGLYQTVKKATVGSASWALSSFGDLFQDQDDYSSFDAFRDIIGSWTNNTLVPQSTDEKFKITKEEGGFKDFEARNYAKLGFSMVPFTGYLISEVKKGNYNGLKDAIGKTYVGLGAKGKVLPQASQKLKDNIIMADAAFRATILDNQKQAEDLGLKGLQATAYATAISSTEALVQSIMPDTQFLKGVGGKAIKESFAGTLKGVANKEGIKSAVKEFSTGILKEYAEEEITLGANILTDASFGLALPKASEFLNQQIELTMGTLMLSGSMGSVGAKNTFSNQKKVIYNQIAENTQSLELHLMTMYKNTNNEENKDKLYDAVIFARDIKKAVESSPENVTSEQIDLLVEKSKLIEKREKTDPAFYSEIDDKIKKIDENIAQGGIKRDILLKIEKDIENVQKSSLKSGLPLDKTIILEDEFVSGDASDKMEETLLLYGTNKETAKANKNNLGAFITDEEGREILVINKSRAIKESVVTTGQHEFLHKLLRYKFAGDSKSLSEAVKLLENVIESLPENQGQEYKRRLSSYKEDFDNGELTEDQFYEENITLFSEALTRKDVNIEKSIYNNIEDFFRRKLQDAGLIKINFNENENSVVNFIEDYNTAFRKGKVSKNLSLKKDEEVAFEKEKQTVSPSKNVTNIEAKIEELSDRYYDGEIDDIDYEQQLENLQKKLETAQKEELAKPQEVKKPKKVEEDIKVDQLGDAINKIIPRGTTKKQYDTETIGKVSEKLVSGKMLDPLIKKIAAGYGIVSDNVYGKSWEDFYDAVKGVQLLKNLQKFNPETNDDFGGFVIGSQFGIRNRVKEALEQFKKENEGGFKEDVETAKGIISEETEIEEGDVKEKTLIDPRKSRIVKDKLPEIEESIDIDPATVTTLTFKNVAEKFGGIAGAKIFDIPVKKVSDPTANLTYATKIVDGVPEYSEAGNIQNAFTNPQQAKEFIKLLPEFNIAGNEVEVSETGEIIDVSSSAKGYAIGVPNNLLKLMYDTYVDPRSLSDSKTERSRAITSPKGRSKGLTSQATVYRLKPEFTGTISNEAVTKFQDMLGITEKGKLNKYDREIGQVLKSVAKLYGSEVANIIVRDKINKLDIKTLKPKSQVLADIAAGKSSVMFSKAAELGLDVNFETESFQKYANSKNSVLFSKEIAKLLVDTYTKDTYEKINKTKKQRSTMLVLDLLEKGATQGIKYFEEYLNSNNLSEGERKLVNHVFEGRDWLFGIFSDGLVKNNGLKYEKIIRKAIKEANIKDVKIDLVLGKGGFDTGTDLVLNIKGKKTNIELKLNSKVRMGSFLIGENNGEFYYTKGVANLSEKLPALHTKIQESLKNENIIKAKEEYVKEGLAYGKKLFEDGVVKKETTYNETKGVLRGPNEVFEYLRKKGLQKKLTTDIKGLDQSIISLIYNNKDVYNIEFGDKGLYFLNENKNDLPIPELKANVKLQIITTKARNYDGTYRTINRAVPYIDSELIPSTVVLTDVSSIKETIEYIRDNTSSNVSFSKNLSEEFNKIIENKTGIAYDQTISEVKAKMIADSKRRFEFFIPPSAEDFVGLLYYTLGKGETGEKQMQFYKRTLLDPYARANQAISRDRNALGRRFKEIKKEFKVTPKDLKKRTPDGLFTREQAVRVFIWDSIGKEIPGLSNKDVKELVDYVKSDKNLSEFATQIMMLNPGKSYTAPTDTWITGTITTDLLEVLNTSRRAMHLKQWQQNVDVIFSNENLNKLEAAYGTQYREAMKNILKRMKTGRNKTYGTDTLTGRFTDWVNGSVGAIMFLNTRSAVLQTISAVNFINFTDNNVLAAGKALANQKQYWTDFTTLFKSEYLVDRRDGLKVNVNEADIADIAKEKGIRGALNYLLKLGFTPTQIADSFAIASGGATFYRNRIKSLVKKGMDPVAAEKLAMRDFIETAEESQQSSRPDKISQQQAGPLGRIVLAFANTPAQYARLIKKAASDLKNGRGDAKTNISKILYYGAVQNIIFNALQQALFAMTFGDEEEEDKKTVDIINGMIDGIARGTGLGGAVFTVVKNTALKLYRDSEKKNPKYEDGFLEVLKISPPISSKIQKLRAAGRTMSWDMDEIKEKGASLESPAVMAGAKVTSAMFNFPADRVVQKIENLVDASDSELETYKRLALVGGWSAWELGIKEEEKKKEVKSNSTRKRSSVKKSVLRKTIIR